MALLPPFASSVLTQHFGNQTLTAEPACYHRGTTDCMFGYYSGAVYAQHFHMGTDWSTTAGAVIRASEAGTVVYEGYAPNPGPYAGGGIICEVAIAGGAHYVNCHMHDTVVSRGQFVYRGQTLGHEGSTGNSTGPHDHFLLFTPSGSTRLFRNPEQFMPGGSQAGSRIILPLRVAANGTGSNIRATANTAGTVVGTTTAGAVYTQQRWVTGGSYTVGTITSNVWAMIWFKNGWRYIAKPLVRSV